MEREYDTDVIVIGGGFAGVTAARELTQRGREVILLEARDRLGGRTWTKPSDLGSSLEMGGTWVHWTQPHVWAEVGRYDLDVIASPTPERALWKRDGAVVSGRPDEMFDLIDTSMRKLLDRATELLPNPFAFRPVSDQFKALDHRTVDDAIVELGLRKEVHDLVEGMWALNFSGKPTNGALTQALRWAALTGGNWELLFEACGVYKIAGGTRALLDAIAGQTTADIRLDRKVQCVEQDANGVTARLADDQTLTAREMIVTLPINVLGSIDFEPALPKDLMSVAAEGQASTGLKVWARVKGDLGGTCALGPSSSVLNFVLPEIRVGDDTLVVAFGSDASRLDISDRAAVELALREWLPGVEVVAVDGHDWVADDLTGQTWPMLRPNQLVPVQEAGARAHGRIRLAGSDYAQGWAGFIDGAIESAKTTAARIHRSLG